VRISIIVPCRNEEDYIGDCLASVLASELAPTDDIEVLVVDGQSRDGTRAFVQRLAEEDPRVHLLDNPQQIVPTALNRGIRAATGEIILRMDAHARYPRDYVRRLVRALVESGADNVGACIVTLPAGPGPVPAAIARVLSHPLGVGNARFRTGTRTQRRVDTVPFGCFRRDVFDRFGWFDEDLVRNQDDEFNHRLIRNGGVVLLVPDVVAHYHARRTFGRLARMAFQYGYFKPLAARKVGRVMTMRQLVPALWLLAIALSAAAAIVVPAAALVTVTIVTLYAAAVLTAAAREIPRHGLAVACALAVAFPVLHVSYGAGFLIGLAHAFRRRAADGRSQTRVSVPLTR
jgi:glycosyltransferase involved in cell wall biosynthesis